MIKQSCDHCRQKYNIPDKFAGKKIRCPGCSIPITVQGTNSSNSVDSKKKRSQKPAAHSNKSHSNPATSVSPKTNSVKIEYSLPWFDPFVALAMIALALGYLAVIVGVISAVIYHATVNYKNILAIGEEVSFLVFVVYLGIIVLGIGIAFFLLKPILAKKQNAIGKLVRQKNEPVLFALLNEITSHFELSPVTVCDLDNSLNVRARVHPKTRETILDLGLPMIASLNQGEAASMIAQELIEKCIEVKSPFTRITRTIHNWFFDAAQLRDSWDHRLNRIRSRRGFFLTPIAMTIQFCVFLNRRIVWIFSVISSVISSFVFRYYYVQAANNVIGFTGASPFIQSNQEIPLLKRAFRVSLVHYVKKFESRHPVDDIAGLVEAERKNLDKDAVSALISKAENQRFPFWNTRPSLEKIKRIAQANPSRGKSNLMGSAKSLFSNFKSLSRTLTLTIQDYLLLGDFVQVRDLDQGMLNIASRKRLPTGMTKVGETDGFPI